MMDGRLALLEPAFRHHFEGELLLLRAGAFSARTWHCDRLLGEQLGVLGIQNAPDLIGLHQRFLKDSGQEKRYPLIVAMARQLAVDLWRWRTGKVKPADLGWVMVGAQA